jgi:hypothetical protein
MDAATAGVIRTLPEAAPALEERDQCGNAFEAEHGGIPFGAIGGRRALQRLTEDGLPRAVVGPLPPSRPIMRGGAYAIFKPRTKLH